MMKLAKMIAYWKKPKQTFSVLHPIRAAKLGAAMVVGQKLFGSSSRR